MTVQQLKSDRRIHINIAPALPWPFFANSLTAAWPALLVLLLINWLVVRGMQRG